MVKKNEKQIDFDLLTFIKTNRNFSCNWEFQKTNNTFIQEILDKTSKNCQGNKGFPDLIYVTEAKLKITYIS